MNIKIKTLDIDIDYTDDNSVPYEEIKRRILEISEAIVSQQLSLEQARREQDTDAWDSNLSDIPARGH